MQTAAKTNRFLIDIFSFKVAEASPTAIYQQIVSELIRGTLSKQTLGNVGNGLVSLADQAYARRQMDALSQVSQLLISLPLPARYESIGRYYQALCFKRQGDFTQARFLLERVAEGAPLRYRARAINSLAAIEFDSAIFPSALKLYAEGVRTATHKSICDPYTVAEAQCMIAILKSVDGDHRGAVACLQSTYPLLYTLSRPYPFLFYNYFNSLAVGS